MRQTMRVPGGSYCDCTPDGAYAVLLPGRHLETHRGPIPLPQTDLLFLRITTVGGFKIAGQGHHDGLAWIWERGAWWSLGEAFGVNPVIFDRNGELVVQRNQGPGTSSQGFRFVANDGRIVTGDETYADALRQIWEYTTYNGVTIGQGNGGAIAIAEGVTHLLEPGDTRFIRVTHEAGLVFAIALVKPTEAVLDWITIDDLVALPPLVTAPPDTPDEPDTPDPPVDPPKERPAMRLPDPVQDLVVALYRAHLDLAKGTDDQRRMLAQKIAEQARFTMGPDWGWKSAGAGRPPSKDAIAYKGGGGLIGWDLFNGATREPNDHPESMDLTGQLFIEVPPVNHLGSAPSEPTKPPVGDDLPAQVRALVARVQALEARPQGGQDEFARTRLGEHDREFENLKEEIGRRVQSGQPVTLHGSIRAFGRDWPVDVSGTLP